MGGSVQRGIRGEMGVEEGKGKGKGKERVEIGRLRSNGGLEGLHP